MVPLPKYIHSMVGSSYLGTYRCVDISMCLSPQEAQCVLYVRLARFTLLFEPGQSTDCMSTPK